MALPVTIEELPRELRDALDDAIASQYWPGGVRALREWLTLSGERPGGVLATLAWFLFQDCSTARADAAEQLIPEILALLDEAVAGGLPREQIAELRDHAAQFLGSQETATSRVLWSLRADPERMPLDQLWELARTLDDDIRERPADAAARFEVLGRRHESAGELERAEEARDRAGLSWARAGDWERARPLLMSCVMRRGETGDRRANLAWGWLVRHALLTEDPDLEMRFEAAVAWGRSSRAGHWPSDHATQDELLRVFLDREAERPVAHLVKVFETRRGPGSRSPEIDRLLHQARKLLRPL